MLIGVPLYALCLGKWGGYFSRYVLEQHYTQLLFSPIKEEEFLFACNLLSPEGSETLQLGEYILLELMRSGAVDANTIQDLKERFTILDSTKRGYLDVIDMIRMHIVVPPDNNNKIHASEKYMQRRSKYVQPDGHVLSEREIMAAMYIERPAPRSKIPQSKNQAAFVKEVPISASNIRGIDENEELTVCDIKLEEMGPVRSRAKFSDGTELVKSRVTFSDGETDDVSTVKV